MKALIYQGNLVDLAKETFEVHPDYFWIDCSDSADMTWVYDDEKILLIPPRARTVTNEEAQAQLLPSIDEKIHALWDMVVLKDESKAMDLDKKIKAIKQEYPIGREAVL